MLRSVPFGLALTLLAFASPNALSADKNEKNDNKKPEVKAPMAGEYTSVGEITGILAKADSSSITLRVSGLGLQKAGGRRSGPALKEVDHDYELQLTPDAKVRLMKLPPKTDEKGHKIGYTFDELVKLKGKSNLPGYEAETSDLKPGMILRLHLVKPRGEKDPQAKPFVNRVYIEGEGPPPGDKKGGDKKPPKKN
jgi:hypothetical protein